MIRTLFFRKMEAILEGLRPTASHFRNGNCSKTAIEVKCLENSFNKREKYWRTRERKKKLYLRQTRFVAY